MRPPSLIVLVRAPPIIGQGRGGHRVGQRHVPRLVQPSHPPVTSILPLFQPSTSLDPPLSPPDVSLPAPSPRPETTMPSTFTPVKPSIALDLPFPLSCYIYTDFFTSTSTLSIYIIWCTPTYYRVHYTSTCSWRDISCCIITCIDT